MPNPSRPDLDFVKITQAKRSIVSVIQIILFLVNFSCKEKYQVNGAREARKAASQLGCPRLAKTLVFTSCTQQSSLNLPETITQLIEPPKCSRIPKTATKEALIRM